jgi:hypothetical protein
MRELADAVRLYEARPQHGLIPVLVRHVRDPITRADETLGAPMTIEAPPHAEIGELVDAPHLIDGPMARRAADTFVHMDRVIEIDEIGDVGDTIPGDGLAREIAPAHGLEHRALVPYLVVATHAEIGGRYARRRGRRGVLVAVETIDAVVLHVMPMIELDGLFDGIELMAPERRADIKHGQRDDGDDAERDRAERNAERRVGPGTKQCRHLRTQDGSAANRPGSRPSAAFDAARVEGLPAKAAASERAWRYGGVFPLRRPG